MLLLHKAIVAFLLAIVTTTCADLPQRMIEAKDTLFHDLQSLHDIIPGQHHHVDEYQRSVEIHDLLNEFLAQNQQSIDAILRVLKLIDQDLENVIHDCVRVFDLDSLQSTNPIFQQVTKPLLLQVRDLCELIADGGGRIDEVEASLERVEQEASVYRESMDQALKDIAVIFGQLEEDHYGMWIERKTVQMEAQLESLNRTLAADLDDTFNKHRVEWSRKSEKFFELLPSDFKYDPQLIPEIALLNDFLNYLDNETTVLQGELEEFLDVWMLTVLETLDILTNDTEEFVDEFLNYPLEKLTNGEASLRCAAAYYENMDKSMTDLLQILFQCIYFEEDMRMAFAQIVPVLDSADKAISFLMDSYISCAKMADQFGLSECLDDLQEFIYKTQEFVEKKASEVYFHVEDAMIFNEVIMGTCMRKEAREMTPQIEGWINAFGDCE